MFSGQLITSNKRVQFWDNWLIASSIPSYNSLIHDLHHVTNRLQSISIQVSLVVTWQSGAMSIKVGQQINLHLVSHVESSRGCCSVFMVYVAFMLLEKFLTWRSTFSAWSLDNAVWDVVTPPWDSLIKLSWARLAENLVGSQGWKSPHAVHTPLG